MTVKWLRPRSAIPRTLRGRLIAGLVTLLAIACASVGLVTSLVPFGTDRGLSLGQGALLVTSFAASQIVGRLVMGLLVDRFRAQATAAAFACLSALAFVGLQLHEPGLPLLLALVFLAGLMNGAEHDLLPFLTARLFGLRAYGETYGTLLMLALAGTATGMVVAATAASVDSSSATRARSAATSSCSPRMCLIPARFTPSSWESRCTSRSRSMSLAE